MNRTVTACLSVCSFCFLIKSVVGESPVWTPTLTKDVLLEKAHAGESYYQAILGIYLRSGEMGMKMDFEASRKWSQKAADGGEPLGLYNLATIAHLAGKFKEANAYYQDAQLRLTRIASQGDPIAQYAMGHICYSTTPVNRFRAINYFRKSAEAGYPQGQGTLGAIYLKGEPQLFKKDTRKGIALLGMAARHHSWTARYNLGMAYYNGEGVAKDNGLAIRWFRLAADQNSAEAQHSLATMLLEVDPAKNKHEIIRLLRLAANQNHAEASKDLKKYTANATNDLTMANGKSRTPTRPTSENQKKALDYRSKGQRYYNGQNIQRNFEKAYACFKISAELGDAQSQRYLAMLYLHGKGCAKNRKEAGKWLRTAVAQGDEDAKKILTTFPNFFKE